MHVTSTCLQNHSALLMPLCEGHLCAGHLCAEAVCASQAVGCLCSSAHCAHPMGKHQSPIATAVFWLGHALSSARLQFQAHNNYTTEGAILALLAPHHSCPKLSKASTLKQFAHSFEQAGYATTSSIEELYTSSSFICLEEGRPCVWEQTTVPDATDPT